MTKEVETDFDLTCWYLNQRRLLELFGLDAVARNLQSVREWTGQRKHLAELAIFKDATTEWLKLNNPPTLGQLLVEDKLRVGAITTIYANFFFKGSTATWKALRDNKSVIPPLQAYAKLDDLKSGVRVETHFHHEHLTSDSAWSELSGQRAAFLLAAVTGITPEKIEVIPYVIAYLMPQLGKKATILGGQWVNRLEIHPDQIDSFKCVQGIVRPTKKALERLEAVPEGQIKTAFAAIIGEPTVPKDWGGENSDLFSSSVWFEGKRISTAIAFKGPTKFRPMTAAHLGKNGDQIVRLFAEPAELMVLQHCHEITTPVRATMRAFAQQMGNLRLFCLIDGYDTLRILEAYGKCGFGSESVSPT